MIRVLITGKEGFIGSALEQLLVSDRRFAVERASVRDGEWRRIDFSKYDSVVHCAGIAHVAKGRSTDAEYDRVNHRLTAQLGAAAKAAGAGQFVFLSSMNVYGQAARVGQRQLIDQQTRPAPADAYGKSKLNAEHALYKLLDENFRVAIVRPPMVYGPGCKGNYNALSALARRLPAFPDFENYRSMIYVENLAECLRQILLRRGQGVYHPQDGRPRSVTRIAREICRVHRKKTLFLRPLGWLLPLLGGVGTVRRAFGDFAYDEALSEFGFEYRDLAFHDAIRVTEQSMRNQK